MTTWRTPEYREYARNHKRVNRLFGRASNYQCLLCFDPADQWAHLWRTHPDAADPHSYVPMCTRDHTDYDREQRRDGCPEGCTCGRHTFTRAHGMRKSEKERAQIAERMRKQWEDPEFRARVSEGMRASWARRHPR